MGNYGNTLDRWYHRAAVVLWRQEDHYPVFFEMDETGFVNELFSLVHTGGSRKELQAMLQHTASYWGNYARRHTEEKEIINVLKLALYLKDSKISTVLLTTYRPSFFNVLTLSSWLKLIEEYGTQWWLEIFNALTSEDKACVTHHGAIKDFSEIIQQLITVPSCQAVIHWLIQYQRERLQHQHQDKGSHRAYYSNAAFRRTDKIIDFMQGMVIARDKESHLMMLNVILDHHHVYPPLFLVGLFDACVPKLNQSEVESWGYNRLFEHVYAALIQEEQRGLRSQEDWRIKEKSICACADCEVLNEFLMQTDKRQIKWLLVENKRFHIEGKLRKLGIPIDCDTEKTGRPYKLVITKTPGLYHAAKKRYMAVQ